MARVNKNFKTAVNATNGNVAPDAVSGANAATNAVDIPLAISTAMNVVAAAATLAAIEYVPSADDANYGRPM